MARILDITISEKTTSLTPIVAKPKTFSNAFPRNHIVRPIPVEQLERPNTGDIELQPWLLVVRLLQGTEEALEEDSYDRFVISLKC